MTRDEAIARAAEAYVRLVDSRPAASSFGRWAKYREAKEAWEVEVAETWRELREAIAYGSRRGA